MSEENQLEISSKLGPCEVCAKNDAKYTCPKCEVKTCCLTCVNIHKKELECDGIRHKVKFIYTPNFTNMDLVNDYKLLEETSRFIYSKKKNKDKRFTSINRDLPVHWHKLKCAAKKRGTVLLFLLENFKRHKNNTTRLNYKLDKIFWKIEWVFVNAYPNPIKICDDKCNEDEKLVKFLIKYLDPTAAEMDIYSKLMYYHSSGFSNCRILLKAERLKSNSRKFHELDVRLTLKENLAGKCIIEYPIIFVILKDHSYDLNIVDSDEELEINNDDTKIAQESSESTSNDTKSNKELFTAKFAKQQKKQIENEIAINKKNIPKNYLFDSDLSSEEEIDL